MQGGFRLLDTQYVTDHLRTFGAVEVPRRRYRTLLDEAVAGDADASVLASDRISEEVVRLSYAPA